MRPGKNTRARATTPALIAMGATCTIAVSMSAPATADQTGLPIVTPLTEQGTGVITPLPVRPKATRLGLSGADLNVLEDHRVRIIGVLKPRLTKRIVSLQLRAHGRWRTIAHTWTGFHGRFVLHYVPRRILSETIRVRFAGDSTDRASDRDLGRLNVYRLAEASWYGGGGTLACGGTLTSSTLGVANKTLPCGTIVTLRYHGRSLRVPVIDRGPYVAGREYDLTEATKRALGFGDLGEVWSIS